MATKNEIIYNVKNIVNRGHIVDDDDINDNLISFWIDNIRAKILLGIPKWFSNIPYPFIQILPYVKMIQVDKSDLGNNCFIPSGCNILRSSLKLPRFITSKDEDFVIGVDNIINSKQYIRTYANQLKYKQYRKFTNNLSYFYLDNDYLFLANEVTLEYVRVTGIFESPEDVDNFNTISAKELNCSLDVCYSRDDEYPFPESLISDLTNFILKEKYGIVNAMPIDLKNDSSGIKQQQPLQQQQEQQEQQERNRDQEQ